MRIVTVSSSWPPVGKPTPKESICVAKAITLPKDIPSLNEFGPLQVRPDCARQPLVEAKIIANTVADVNGMSLFSGT